MGQRIEIVALVSIKAEMLVPNLESLIPKLIEDWEEPL